MAQCKGCGKEIIFATSMDSGSKLPLEVCKHVYRNVSTASDSAVIPLMVAQIREEPVYVSHFLTCKKATAFSGSKEKGPN